MIPRVYPILDAGALAARGLGLVEAAEALLEGGAGILQIRNKQLWTREFFAGAEEVARLSGGRAILMINDRADIARLLGAGVHLGQDDLAPADARRVLAAGALVGFSTHNAGQLEAAQSEPVDYVALGPIFATGSKPDPDPEVGIERLRAWRASSDRPLVAIGGVTRANARAVLAAGADSVAVIGDLLPETSARRALRERMEEWSRLVTLETAA
ncbi:MAG: thiamine phosphate synthase [Acidobacteria bacterium]|nr:thiamine phosphate synthase [Acidobacteriota bacterium]